MHTVPDFGIDTMNLILDANQNQPIGHQPFAFTTWHSVATPTGDIRTP